MAEHKMNILSQGEGTSVQPEKRGRGRPRKFPTPTSSEAAPSVGLIEYLPERSRAPEPKLGQPVTGFIEGAFDKGYLVSVQIGNSIMRGLVFKPEQSVPVTAENDVAPHLPMIERRGKKRWFRKTANQTASKRNLEPSETVVNPTVPNHGDGDLEMVEQLAIIPLVQSESVGQILVHEIAPEILQIGGGGSSNADTIVVAQEEKDNNPGSPETLFHVEIEKGKEELEPSAQNGKITEVLEEDETDVRIFEESTSITLAEFDEIMATEADNKNESIIP